MKSQGNIMKSFVISVGNVYGSLMGEKNGMVIVVGRASWIAFYGYIGHSP